MNAVIELKTKEADASLKPAIDAACAVLPCLADNPNRPITTTIAKAVTIPDSINAVLRLIDPSLVRVEILSLDARRGTEVNPVPLAEWASALQPSISGAAPAGGRQDQEDWLGVGALGAC